MSPVLQGLLLAGCLLTFGFVIFRIRRAQMQIHDSIFWIGFSGLLLICAVFPRGVERLASLAGVAGPVNFVFLVVIFVLLAKIFALSIQVSRLDSRLSHLTQRVAVDQVLGPQAPTPED